MAFYTFRKVNCVDPCDPDGIKTRQLALLIQTHPAPSPTNTNLSRPVGWLAEPTLVNPVRMVKKITADTVIQQIHVIDPVFGDQILQYITDVEPSVHFSVSNDRKGIEALWAKSVPAPKYTPGQARANPYFTPGEVKLDGARSDFTVCISILSLILRDTNLLADDRLPTMPNILLQMVSQPKTSQSTATATSKATNMKAAVG